MRDFTTIAAMAAALLLAGCGASDDPGKPEKKDETMKVEDTVFAPVVTAPERVQDRTNAAVDQHRENLDKRLQEDEGT